MDRKWTHVLFAVAGMVLAWLLAKCGDWVWVYFSNANKSREAFIVNTGAVIVAAVITYVAWRNEEIFGFASEVTSELGKVTWPTRRETQAATIVVIVTVFVSATFLKLFDGMWSWFTRLIYG